MYKTRDIEVQSVDDSLELMKALKVAIACGVLYFVIKEQGMYPRDVYIIGNLLCFFAVGVIMYMLFSSSLRAICSTEDTDAELQEVRDQITLHSKRQQSKAKLVDNEYPDFTIAPRHSNLVELDTFTEEAHDFTSQTTMEFPEVPNEEGRKI